jgi:uncharacterized integral membrane protein
MAGATGQPGASPQEKQGGRPRRRNRGELARTGAVLVIAVLVTLFAVKNAKQVQVDWVVGSGKAPLIVVILVTLLAGIVITYLAERLRRRKRK